MINKTMPERIDELMDALRRASNDTGVDACDKYGQPPEYIDIHTPYLPGQFVAPTGSQRYVRAPDPNEPLEAEQYRWVKLTQHSEWCVAEIRKGWIDPNALVYFACGDEVEESVDDCYAWGPVIRPPETL